MNIVTKALCISLVIEGLSGCSTTQYANSSRLCADDNGDFYNCSDLSAPADRAQTDPTLYQTNLHFQLLSEYTEQMAADLQRDLAGAHIEDPIFVSSFVYFDSTLRKTSALGNQLAEYFINDLQEIGLPVVDHKLTDILTVNAHGDFVLARDQNLFTSKIDVGYVLVGTLVENDRGVIINARLVNFKTNKVVASTSKFMPNILASK